MLIVGRHRFVVCACRQVRPTVHRSAGSWAVDEDETDILRMTTVSVYTGRNILLTCADVEDRGDQCPSVPLAVAEDAERQRGHHQQQAADDHWRRFADGT